MNGTLRSVPLLTSQTPLFGVCPVEDALAHLSQANAEARGAIYTRCEVVEFILDLVGYTVARPLYDLALLEPSFGDGDFLFAAVTRLLDAWKREKIQIPVRRLAPCIRAVELHEATFVATRDKLHRQLGEAGINREDAEFLSTEWLVHGDFLLTKLPSDFAFVVGNPPYVRQELIPEALITEYRARYKTVFDRADLYIPFIERSVTQLACGGKVGIICADRWTKNRYGGPLRDLLSKRFRLHVYVDMFDTDAFQSDVVAYPAIFVFGRDDSGPTRVARRPAIDGRVLTSLAGQLVGPDRPVPGGPVSELSNVANGAQPWILESSDRLRIVRRLEQDLPTIEDAGCRVGIGVATGADGAFIGPYDELDVEDDRKLPLATTRDVESGEVRWRGLGVVNPFADEGGLVDLKCYPRLARYLEKRRNAISKRHVAQRAPDNWYRTIDRIHPSLAETPKLLIPDIKGSAHVVYEDGRLYPHHNLYFVTSRHWNLLALRAVLISEITGLFIEMYSTRMRGGYLRFQAQYLRRIRLPDWSHVGRDMASALIDASVADDLDACNQAALDLYGLTDDERSVLSAGGTKH